MKKNALLIGALALFATGPVLAQDLVIETIKGNENIELVQDAIFDVVYGNVGQTSNMTIVGLGEVDFGADGNAYKATGVEFAQGWGDFGVERYVVLSAGETSETAVPFTEMLVDRTYGYHCFEMFAYNMKESEDFERPIGKQKVWLTFRLGNGNLRSVKFYQEAFAEADEGVQPWPSELPEYKENATIIGASEFVRAVAIPEDPDVVDPYKDTKYDGNSDCWGGVREGFIAKSTEKVDFGNGEFQQLVAFIGHDGERYREYMEFYIDEVKPENMIARTWSGINLQKWNDFTPIATQLKKVTGSHYLFVKWGDATNLHRIDLLKEPVWFENPQCGIVFENVLPSEDAVVYVTKGTGESGGDPAVGEMEWKVVVAGSANARGEGNNIGYTSNGVVVCYYDVDFKDGEYKRVIINHSCDKNWLGTIDEANFSLYTDLDDIKWGYITNTEELNAALADHEPIAKVRAQGTGAWSIKEGTAGLLKEVKGVQNLYIVYNLPQSAGANIYGLYLDPNVGETTGIKSVTSIKGLDIYSVNEEVIVNSAEEVNIAIYTVNGVQIANKRLPAGITTIRNFASGLYILKAVNKQGAVKSTKLLVK